VIFITQKNIDLVVERVVEDPEREEIAGQFGGEEWQVSAKTGMDMAELTAKNGRNWKINVKRKEHSGRTGD
jgi:hypothetical protein